MSLLQPSALNAFLTWGLKAVSRDKAQSRMAVIVYRLHLFMHESLQQFSPRPTARYSGIAKVHKNSCHHLENSHPLLSVGVRLRKILALTLFKTFSLFNEKPNTFCGAAEMICSNLIGRNLEVNRMWTSYLIL